MPPGYQPGAPAALGEFAGFWIRFAGLLLDSLLYGLLSLAFLIPAVAVGFASFRDCEYFEASDEIVCPPGSPQGGLLAAGIVLAVIGVLVVAFFYLRALGRGQTWGMRITHIKLVRSDNGAPVGFGKALGRSVFASLVSAQVLYVGYLWAAWDDQKQTWQDKIVGTYVVRA